MSSCVLLSACGPDETAVSGETAVKEAAQQRWDAMIEGDFRMAYQHYTDAFKETVSLKHFRKQVSGVGLWNKAQVESVKCDETGERCDAEVEVTVAMKMRGLPKPVKTSDIVRETWIKKAGFSDWRYVKK